MGQPYRLQKYHNYLICQQIKDKFCDTIPHLVESSSEGLSFTRPDCSNKDKQSEKIVTRKRRLVEPPFLAKNNMIKVLLFHDSAFEFTIFSADIVEVYASVEAAAIDDKLGGLAAIHGFADDLFAKNIEHAD